MSLEKLRKTAESNLCKSCYSKYLVLIHGEIEYLLSEPISDWRQTEANIDIMWIKAKGLYDVVDSTVFSPHENAFKKAKRKTCCRKLEFLKKKQIMNNHTYEFLNQVRKRRNKIHPPSKFSKQDYVLFREAKELTDTTRIPIIHDLKDNGWKTVLANVEKHAKLLIEKFQLS